MPARTAFSPSRTRRLPLVAAAVLACAGLAGSALAQNSPAPARPTESRPARPAPAPTPATTPAPAQPAQPNAMPEMDPKMMEMMEAAAAPGERHKLLAEMEGEFDALVRWWMAPGTPVNESKGTMRNRMEYGGRYLLGDFAGDMMGTPFQGTSLTGYNNTAKRFEGVWFDSMSTGMMFSVSTGDASGRSFEMSGDYHDPMTGQKTTQRQVIRVESRDRHSMEMFSPGPDGKDFKMMEIIYTRRAAPGNAPATAPATAPAASAPATRDARPQPAPAPAPRRAEPSGQQPSSTPVRPTRPN